MRTDMSTSEWHKLIKPVLPHASTDKDTPWLATVRIEADLALYAVATDRYTLGAERHPLDPSGIAAAAGIPAIHLRATEVKASLTVFPYSKDDDPPLKVIVDRAPIPLDIGPSVMGYALTLQSGDGTRIVMRDVRQPDRDALAGWRKNIRQALRRGPGRALGGLPLSGQLLARWQNAVRGGERLTFYTGPEPGDALLVTVEDHFAGLWSVPQYLDTPGKVLRELPWDIELAPLDELPLDEDPGADLETGEKRGSEDE